MYRLLHRDPKNRLGSREGANEVKQHPFFRGMNWALVRCMVITATLPINDSSLFIRCKVTRSFFMVIPSINGLT